MQQHRLAVVAAACLLSSCSRSLDPVRGDIEGILYSINNAAQNGGWGKAADSDEEKRAAMRRTLVDPVERAGYNLERSLKACAAAYSSGDLPDDRRQEVGTFLKIYAANREELVRLGFLSEDAAACLDAY